MVHDLSAVRRLRQVVDVGGGTGFCTQGIVKHVQPQNVTLIDQSPDQLNKARQKADLQGVTIVEVRGGTAPRCPCTEPLPCQAVQRRIYALAAQQLETICQAVNHVVQGDAEDLPFATDSFDRYVSAGSIGELHRTPRLL
jgi:MPBQ/MSBQ methyltransferase